MMDTPRRYRSSAAARWLPRTLAVACIVAGALAADGVRGSEGPMLDAIRWFFLLTGLVGAAWFLRGGAEVRKVAFVDATHLHLGAGGRESALELDRIQRIEFQSPFARSRQHWLPAAALIDEFGHSWRLPATIEAGDQLVSEIVERAGDDELATWTDALNIRQRMARPRLTLWIGYGTAVLLVLFSLLRRLL